jgi:paraquat-inducible protein A
MAIIGSHYSIIFAACGYLANLSPKIAVIRYILLVVHVISLVLLGFGLVKDVLQIDVSAHFLVDINLFNETRSVISTLQNLWRSDNYWPFFLIFLFGIMVPIIKSLVIFYLLLAPNPKNIAYAFVNVISKWAMADVFAIAIFVAFLGARAMENTKAILLPGFYYFSAYVLLSAAITMFLPKMLKKAAPINA